VSLCALSNHGDDPRHAQLRAFFDCPLHAVKLEDGEQQGHIRYGRRLDFLPQLELDATVADGGDAPAADAISSCDVKLLTHASPQDPCQMLRVLTSERSVVSRNFVSDPATAGHENVAL
jgi:hypothetical protein